MARKTSMRGLIVRLIMAVLLSWLGLIALLIHRLERLKMYENFSWMQDHILQFDIAGGALFFMGFFLVFFFLGRLRPHLVRMAELGLDRW